MKLSMVDIGGISRPGIGLVTLHCGGRVQPLGQLELCGWNLTVGSPRVRDLTVCLEGLTKMVFRTHKEMDGLGVYFRRIALAWHVKGPGFDLRTEQQQQKPHRQ